MRCSPNREMYNDSFQYQKDICKANYRHSRCIKHSGTIQIQNNVVACGVIMDIVDFLVLLHVLTLLNFASDEPSVHDGSSPAITS